MQRVLTTVTLLGLLVATAAAFAITEHLKLIKSPIYGTEVSNRDGVPTKLFSPVCQCANSAARLTIRLRHHDHVTVTIVDAEDRQVATIASDEDLGARAPQQFVWDGRMADGTQAPDGVYHPWVSLSHARHTYRFTNKIILDTTPPKVRSASVGDSTLFAGSSRTVAISYSFSEKAHAVVYLGRRKIILGRETQQPVKWAGTVGGKPLPAGTYVLSVGGQDLAGNETPAAERSSLKVDVRYVELSPGRIAVRSGTPFRVHVKTAARHYTWRLGHRHGSRRGKSLRLRAPTTPGTYRLVVTAEGQGTTAVVRVHG